MKRTYFKSMANPTGEEVKTHCVHAIAWCPQPSTNAKLQCSRKRGYGPKGLYCKQHARMAERGSP